MCVASVLRHVDIIIHAAWDSVANVLIGVVNVLRKVFIHVAS